MKNLGKFSVQHVNVLSDNFSYILRDLSSKNCLVVDISEADKVFSECEKQGLTIKGICSTHHHMDHVGGNADLLKLVNDEKLPVYGGDDRIPCLTHKVAHDDVIDFGPLKIRVLSTPCHTTGHVCYFVNDEESGERAVFTGDTLFLGGCGRFFEGTADQMEKNLNSTLASLPDDTKVYCGHEYTVANLTFGSLVDTENAELREKLEWATAQREKGENTIPGTIGNEKQTNVFMRTSTLKDQLKQATAIDAMRELREMKNNGLPKK